MSATPILFAAGSRGVTLNVPEGVAVEIIGRPVDATAPRSDSEQRAVVEAALAAPVAGVPLRELARGKRRAVILAGDLSRPAPYEIILSALTAELMRADIRPSRIALCACPGGGGPLLGRAAIHRYGEEFCGDHEAVAWPNEGTPGAIYDTADLRIAVASTSAFAQYGSFLPKAIPLTPEMVFLIALELGPKTTIDIESAQAFGPSSVEIFVTRKIIGCDPSGIGHTFHLNRGYRGEYAAQPPATVAVNPSGSLENAAQPHDFNRAMPDVWLTSGGGSAWEATLEEAMLGLSHQLIAQTAVLVFSGAEGLGSARFAQDFWALIEQAEEVLATGKTLDFVQKPGTPYDPASTLAECLSRYKNTVLFAPEFCAHSEGEDLGERIAAAPYVAKRLALCGAEREMWAALEMLHGATYTLAAQPLGWRAF